MKKYIIILICTIIMGCASLNTNYKDPISYDIEIGKTTESTITHTLGLGKSSSTFRGEHISTYTQYSCGKESALTLCVIKNDKKICTPCGVPVDNHEPYTSIGIRFYDGVLKEVNYFTGKPYHPMITSEWINRAPKQSIGNYNTPKIGLR